MATKFTILMIMMFVAFIIISWSVYSYFIEPGMVFWETHAKEVVEAKNTFCATSPNAQEPIPVSPGG